MNRDYDIFEKLPDGSPLWPQCVQGSENARSTLNLLAAQSQNEFFAVHSPTSEIIIRVNVRHEDGVQPKS